MKEAFTAPQIRAILPLFTIYICHFHLRDTIYFWAFMSCLGSSATVRGDKRQTNDNGLILPLPAAAFHCHIHHYIFPACLIYILLSFALSFFFISLLLVYRAFDIVILSCPPLHLFLLLLTFYYFHFLFISPAFPSMLVFRAWHIYMILRDIYIFSLISQYFSFIRAYIFPFLFWRLLFFIYIFKKVIIILPYILHHFSSYLILLSYTGLYITVSLFHLTLYYIHTYFSYISLQYTALIYMPYILSLHFIYFQFSSFSLFVTSLSLCLSVTFCHVTG